MQSSSFSPDGNDQLNIDHFPNEIFEKIISYLNVEDCKVASLVNYRWSQFAFSRLTLGKVQLEVNCAQRCARDYWNVLENSSRNYRNIVLKFAQDEEGFLLRIMDKFQHSLERVSIEQDADARLLHTEISCDYLIKLMQTLGNVTELMIKTIIELEDSVEDGTQLPRLEQLESICFYTHCLEEKWIDWTLICPKVKSIGVPLQDGREGFPRIIRNFSNQLTSMSIDARFLERDSLSFVNEDFLHLNKFRILYPINNPSVGSSVDSFIQRCSQLTEISLFSNTLSRETLQTIAEHCQQLKVVSIDSNEVPNAMFAILSKLPRLRQLILHKMTVEPAMITSSGCFPSMSQLTCLSIRINVPDAFFAQLHKKMPKLAVLELLDRFRFGISNFNQTGVISALCCNLTNLEQLALVDWAILDTWIFEKLDMLKNLVELRIKCIGLNANKALPVCANIKKLILDVDSLKPTEVIPPVYRPPLAELISNGFPGLKTFELRKSLTDRTKISEQEIASLQSTMTECVFYRKTRLMMANKDYTSLM